MRLQTFHFIKDLRLSTLLTFTLGIGSIASATNIRDIVLTYQGAATTGTPLTAKEYGYLLSSTAPVREANKVSFTSNFRFYSRYTQGTPAGVAQLFRRNTNYKIEFEVRDTDQVGYTIMLRRRLKGSSSVLWSGYSSGSSSTATVSLTSGRFYSGSIFIENLTKTSLLNRTARESNPSPEDQEHISDATVMEGPYTGNQNFTLRIDEAATQISHVFQNYNYGESTLRFGLVHDPVTGYQIDSNDYGDTIFVHVIFNPAVKLTRTTANDAVIEFSGVLQTTDNLGIWQDVMPQPSSPFQVDLSGGRQFFRARSIE